MGRERLDEDDVQLRLFDDQGATHGSRQLHVATTVGTAI
jgi:hypothetical protein